MDDAAITRAQQVHGSRLSRLSHLVRHPACEDAQALPASLAIAFDVDLDSGGRGLPNHDAIQEILDRIEGLSAFPDQERGRLASNGQARGDPIVAGLE